MRRTTLLLASLLVSVLSFAQWTKPVPTAQPITVGEECYLYNLDAEGFLLGANDWGTRASYDRYYGHKVYLQKYEGDEVAWDGKSYFITNFIEQGGMANQVGSMFIDGEESIWVDRATDIKAGNQGFTFENQGGNIFRIGFSPANTTFNEEGAYLGGQPWRNDTRLYLCRYNEDSTDQLRWVIVSAAEYPTFVASTKQYDAAVKLGAAIEKVKAENEGIDLSSVEAVYNNHASTPEQLLAAITDAYELGIAFQTARVSPTTPANYTTRIANASYDEGNNDGWKGNGVGVSFGVCEMWNANSINYYQELANLPKGVYRVSVTGFYRSGSNDQDCAHQQNPEGPDYHNAKLYAASAQELQAAIPYQHSGAVETAPEGSTGTVTDELGVVPNNMESANAYFQAGLYQPTTLLCNVGDDGKLTIGLKKTEHIGDDWLIFDNWKLEYLGATDEAYQMLATEYLQREPDYKAEVEAEDLPCQKSIFNTYVDARETLTTATDGATIAATLPVIADAAVKLASSIKAYAQFAEKVKEAKQWMDNEMTVENDYTIILSSYLLDEEATGFNGNGSSLYILENGTLDEEQLKAEKEYLQKIFENAVANSMADGDDCTALLKNPNFTEAGGWTSAVGPTWPMGEYHVGEAMNMIFDVYQEISGLQNGLYEFTTYDVYLPTEAPSVTGTENTKAYIYINDYKKKMNTPGEGASEEQISTDDWQHFEFGWIPNSAAAAAQYFAAGRYQQTVYGLVTDGTMKVGYRNDLRYADGSRAWWGPAKLIFRAKNADALADVIENLQPEIEDLLEVFCGKAELNALMDAQDAANYAEGSDALYTALIQLKQAMDAVKEGGSIYQKLYVAVIGLAEAIDAAKDPDAITLAAAQEAYARLSSAQENQELNNEEANAAIEELNALSVALKLGKQIASEENPVDMTSAIVNNNFDPARGEKGGAIEGWVSNTPTNGYKQYTCSYNRAGIDLYQKLTGLPKGKYKVTVHTYYRAGYWDEEWARKEAGEETHLTTLYAQTSTDKYTVPVMNLWEDAQPQPMADGNFYNYSEKYPGVNLYAPDGTGPTAASFAAGYYLNELRFYVGEDGEATIGLKKDEVLANDYQVVGEWNLWYMGDETEVRKDTIDMTSVIVNNNFDPARGEKGGAIEGWVSNTPTNGYKQYTCSYNRAGIDLYQDLSGLPVGKYLVTVHTYYRAGYWDEEWARKEAGEETHLTTLYAETSADKYTTPVMNLWEDAQPQPMADGNFYNYSEKYPGVNLYAPDGTGPTAASFAAGYYLNKLEFNVGEDGKARIGLKKDEILANDYQVVGEWRLYLLPEDNQGELDETDVTSLIVNNNFDPARGEKGGAIEGWVSNTPTNGYKQYTCSYNRAGIDLYQDLSGLPEGTYKVTVHTYYRAGYWDEEWARKEAGEETHLTTLYAQTTDEKYCKPVMNLWEDAQPQPMADGNFYNYSEKYPGVNLYAPDGTGPTAASFAAGYYLNELPFYVGNDGKARIGLKKDEVLANDYQVVGEWRLYYYGSGNNVDKIGDEVGIETVEAASATLVPVAFYNLNGVRLAQPQRGINIVKMSDGSAIKIVVK